MTSGSSSAPPRRQVLADWWFSLALSKDIYQPMPGERTRGRLSQLRQKATALSESQPLKGLTGTWDAMASCPERACLMQASIKSALGSRVRVRKGERNRRSLHYA